METNASLSETILPEDMLVRASTGKRFANYIIDIIFFYILVFILGIVMAFVTPSSLEGLDESTSASSLMLNLLSIVLLVLMFGGLEALLKGKTIGKLITGTRAVNLDGSPISAGQAFGRALSRLVPFEPFSAFGNPCNPWHDRWTDTMVIDERESAH
jgi:uncharacterized RDD family membrane protein YckC